MINKISIAILGSKGGVGKTTCSHLLAYGLAHFNAKTVLVTTDFSKGREVLSEDKRQYSTVSGQSVEKMGQILDWFGQAEVADQDRAALVLDGGGNRPDLDKLLAQHVDLVILPFRESEEDYRVVREDMLAMPTALALPSAWPTNSMAYKSAQSAIEKMEAEFPGRVLSPLPSCRASQKILMKDYQALDTQVKVIAKNLAEQVLARFNINAYK